MRYGYFAYEQRKTSIKDMAFEFIGFAEVNPESPEYDRSAERLHDWALGLLTTCNHEAGYFVFNYGQVGEDGEPEDILATLDVAWNGDRELAAT
ncbi:hypothetical protein [Amycolatopsis samaneae]|uniref:Uncharacterized protein n=1 Tax=Amycolatopsis samaneae TaxID=664691 RepID=A0ABW5GGT1_9PSEU